MPRTASSRLIAHMSSPSATIAYLQKTGPLPDGSYHCMNTTAKDIVYDDGSGSRTYYARTGIQLANLSGSNDLTSDNTEAQTLTEIPTYPGQGITVAMVENGDLDGVEYVIYAINYEDHSMGHMILSGGPVGQVRVTPDGQLITVELRGWCDLLRQNSVVELWSLTCRAKEFGSQPGEERYPCKFDASGLWVYGAVVTDQGAETVRDFTAAGVAGADELYNFGKIFWQTGANAGRKSQVETFGVGGVFSLRFLVRHAIEVGDVFDLQRGCSRMWSGPNSCDTYGNRLNFRGEPFQPAADAIGLSVPGAAAGGYS